MNGRTYGSGIIDYRAAPSGEPIYKRAKRQREKNSITAFLFLVVSSGLIFWIGSIVYQRMDGFAHAMDTRYWLRGFYHFSLVLGILSVAAVAVFFIVNEIQGVWVRRSFQQFLERLVRRAAKYPIIYQDREAYYLAEEPKKPMIRLLKDDCLELTTTFDGASVCLGDRQEFLVFLRCNYLY